MELADFLLARIAEDEEVARRAGTYPFLSESPEPWWPYKRPSAFGVWASPQPRGAGRRVAYATTESEQQHIARWDPARVLAECEAKRLLIALGEKDSYWDDVLRILALPYADHPDYDPAWRP